MLRLLNPALRASACLGLILAAAPVIRADAKNPRDAGDGPPAAAPPAPAVEDAQDEVELRELRLELKKAELDEARANLALAMANLARAEELAKAPGAISAEELDQRRAAVASLKPQLRIKDVEVREAEIHLRQAKRRLDRARAAAGSKEEANAAAKKNEEEIEALKKDYEDALAKLTKRYKDDRDKEMDEKDVLRKELEERLKKSADKEEAAEEKRTAAVKEGVVKDQKIKELEGRLADLQDRLDALAKRGGEAPATGGVIPTDWKIVRMDRPGKLAFINLGSAEAVRPGLTFSIHGSGPDGKPLLASKGAVEVIDVLGEHLGQVKVVAVEDATKDPILPGDYLYNPLFHTDAPAHVVIAGRIDMHGDKQQDDLEELQKLLKQQNTVVDGYVDPLDGAVKGKLTVGTEYLILGEVEGARDAAAASIKALQEQARNNGVRIIRLPELLNAIGYRAP